jgi:hypothetical protein
LEAERKRGEEEEDQAWAAEAKRKAAQEAKRRRQEEAQEQAREQAMQWALKRESLLTLLLTLQYFLRLCSGYTYTP